MKAFNLILALAAPALMSAGYSPSSYNSLIVNEIQIQDKSGVNDDFRLSKQPYYKELFNAKELKKLAKAEKFRLKSSEALVLAAASQKQAEDLRTSSPVLTDKIQKQIAKLEATAAQQELNGLKTFGKASDIFRVVYTNVLNNSTFTAATSGEKAAQQLAMLAHVDYQNADSRIDSLNSGNALESYRAIYTSEYAAVHKQEIAFALLKGDSKVDCSEFQDVLKPDAQSLDGNIPKDSIPLLIAAEHYDFARDTNIYRIRFHQFEDRMKVSDADKKAVLKLEADEATAATLFSKAQNYGCTADTFRVYSGQATTLAEREYYEQKAQESELNECSNLLKAANLQVAANNSLYAIYKKYVPGIRNAKDSVGMDLESQANGLFSLSKTYDAMAASQYSHVEQYTQLMEGNEVKLQAIKCMENAVAKYLGDTLGGGNISLASGASERHNDVPMDFMMDESDGASTASKPASQKTDNKPANQVADSKPASQKTDNKPANQVVDSKPASQKTDNKPANQVADSKPASQKTDNKPASQTSAAANPATRQPAMASSSAAVVSTSYYTKGDQRMKPYSFPSGAIFSVEAGIYKEMPEPVEFPAVEKFLAQNLKGVVPMRYYIGECKTYDAAVAICALAKENGYKNAKVAAFVNGKPSDVAAAKKTAEKSPEYQNLVQQELKAINAVQRVPAPAAEPANQAIKPGQAIPLSQLSGEQYVVQISSVPALLDAKAFNVSEVYYDRNQAGLYRYYAGASPDVQIAASNLSTMRQAGYQDAYLVRVADGRNMGAVSQTNGGAKPASYPVYRVQVGAFKSALSDAAKTQMDSLKKAGYAVHTSQSGEYTVICVGDCGSRGDADHLRAELRGKGYPEAYVVTFVNGVKQ